MKRKPQACTRLRRLHKPSKCNKANTWEAYGRCTLNTYKAFLDAYDRGCKWARRKGTAYRNNVLDDAYTIKVIMKMKFQRGPRMTKSPLRWNVARDIEINEALK